MKKKSVVSKLLILGVFLLFLFALPVNGVLADHDGPGKGYLHGGLFQGDAQLKGKVITLGDQEIAYYESTGKGPTVVLVHGNSSSSWSYLHQLLGSLGKRFHLVAMDLPGHGRSSNALAPFPTYTLPNYAGILVQFVNTLGLNNAVFVGWSLGGHVLLEASSQLPNAAGLMIFGTPPVDASIIDPEILKTVFNILNPAFFLGSDDNWTNVELELYASSFFKPEAKFIPDFFFKDGRRTDGIARSMFFMSLLLPGMAQDEVQIVGNLSVPLAIIHGQQDQFVHLDYIESLTYLNLWRGRVHVIKNAGHAPHWETPVQFDALLSAFIRDVAQ